MKVSECKEIFALLSQYLDKELPDDLCGEIDSHISGCPPCVQFVESLKRSVDLCKECKQLDHPGPLPEAARDRLFAAYQKALEARRHQQT
jgi:RNA polymerase sigma-70 factor (ECF subfamily)